MEKEITYKGKKHKALIKWSGSAYAISVDGKSFQSLTFDALKNIKQLKIEIIRAIEYVPELALIKEWDGNLDD